MKHKNREIQVQSVPNPFLKAEATQLLMRTIDMVRMENKNLIKLVRREDYDKKAV